MKKITFSFLLLLTFCCNLFAQQTAETYTVQQLQARFRQETYTEKVLIDFQKTIINLRKKPELHEDIPGEIISWYTLNGEFSWHKTYLIQKNGVKEIETIPKDDIFLKKLNTYVPEKSKFSYTSDLWSFAFVEKKLNNNSYLIKSTIKSFNSYPELPNDDILVYDIEYKTKDFKTFYLVRLKDIHTDKWIEVAEY